MISLPLKQNYAWIISSIAFLSIITQSAVYSQQYTIFSTDFESGSADWTSEGIVGENTFTVAECAGNGTSFPGDNAVYVTNGVADICGNEFAYINGTNAVNEIYFHREVIGCGTNMQLTFDYIIEGNPTNFGEVVYSTDGGTSWDVALVLTSSSSWINNSFSLPSALDNTTFLLGFRFTYDDNVPLNIPLGFDNILLTANDTEDPTITCPANDVVNIGTNCSTTVGDYTGLVSANDNCGIASVTQLPPAGATLITGNHQIRMTAVDLAGNSSICTFNLLIEEDELPEITCPSPISSCEAEVTYTAPVGTDNCVAITTQIDNSGFTSGDEFPLGITTITYQVADSSGNTAQCSFTVEVLSYPDTALTMANFELCDTISAVIIANEPTSGVGEWILHSGSGAFNNQFSATTGVNNLSIGVNQLVWTISTPTCGQTSDTLTITVHQLPLPASAVDTVYACDSEVIQITANLPSVGTGLWYDVNGGIVFSNPTAVPTAVSNLQEGWNQVVWSISNGNCPVSRDTMHIYSTETATIINPLEDTISLCLNDTEIIVAGNEAASGTNTRWYFAFSGFGFISNSALPETQIDDIAYGHNVLVYEVRRPECPARRDTIYINVDVCGEYGNFPNMITPNGDGQNDVWVLDNLSVIYPECVVKIFNRWGNLVFESIGYKDNWDGRNNKDEKLPMGTYYYLIELNDIEKTIIKGHVSIIY